MHSGLKRITYVEDEPDIRTVAEMALRSLGGFELDVCTRGDDALARLPEYLPDLVLLDVMMPGIDGLTVFRRMRHDDRIRDIPVIFMTAKAQKQEVQEYLDAGASGVITKPFDPMTLCDTVTAIWAQAQG